MKVLVTGTSTFFSPRLIQGFTALGAEVTVADDHWWSIGKSMPGTRWLRTPSLSHNPAGYLAALIGELKTRPYDLLLPTFEESLLLAEFRDEVESLTTLRLPSFEVMWQLHHKPSLNELCCELNIPTPPTVPRPHPDNLQEQVKSLRFPVVLKLPASNNSVGREYCETLQNLENRFRVVYERQIHHLADPPFVQQKIDGDAIYTLMLCSEGQKLGEVIYRPLRTFPENGGTSTHRETIAHPQIAALTQRLAESTGWSGFLGLDFIVDRIDGTPYLIDANPRANPAVQLGYLAGVDWTQILIELQSGRRPTPVTASAGVRSCTPLLDVLWMLEGLAPRRQWGRNLLSRLSKVLRPDWNLDSGHDFKGSFELLPHMAVIWQSFSAIFKSLVTGKSIGQAFMNGANYDPVTIMPLRYAAKRIELPAPEFESVDSL
jgi:hypothetical protein